MKILGKMNLVLILTGFIFFNACNKKDQNNINEKDIVKSVKYEEVGILGKETSKYSGTIKSFTESNLSFKVSGNIEKIYVKIGDKVKKGQLLAVLDKSSYELQLKQARASYQQVKASSIGSDYQIAEAKTGIAQSKSGIMQATSGLDQAKAAYKMMLAKQTNAKQEFERYKTLYLNDNIPQSAFDQVKLGLDQANAAVDQAKAAVDQAKAAYEQTLAKQNQTEALLEQSKMGKSAGNANLDAVAAQVSLASLQLSYTELRAPADGIVSMQMAEENENIGAGTPIFKIDSDNNLQAEIYISEVDINSLKLGDKANILIESINKSYQGTVAEIGSSSTGFGGTYIMKVGIDNIDNLLKIGMSAKVIFDNNANNKGVFTLPLTAVNEDSKHKKYVYVIENIQNKEGIIRKKEITIGKLIDNRMEILSGIDGKEKVVTAGVNMVTPGQKVKLYEEEK